MILWSAQLEGPKAMPGSYKVMLEYGETKQEQPFSILKDPRTTASLSDMQSQFDFLIKNRDKLTETHEAILAMRKLRSQCADWKARADKDSSMAAIREKAAALVAETNRMEETLYQTKSRSPQDPLNFPIRLNNKLGHLGSLTDMGNFAPTDQAVAVQAMLFKAIDEVLADWNALLETEVPAFNALIKKADLPAISVD
jgi:hypothetical protein